MLVKVPTRYDQPFARYLQKHLIFWSEFTLSGDCRVAEWIREKSGHFWVKQHWDRIVLGWETCLGTLGAGIFFLFFFLPVSSWRNFNKTKVDGPNGLGL